MAMTRERLRALFGLEEPELDVVDEEVHEAEGHIVEIVRLSLGGEPVRGILTRPKGADGRLPAILYGHSHGGIYDIGAEELTRGRSYLLSPLGPVFAEAGYVSFCLDMPVFGERATIGESAAAKALLWYGKSLFGQMLGDHAAGLSYLAGRGDVDAARIGGFGMSMGATLTYWLAAVDERLKAVAHLCCYADQRVMIAMGKQDGHGIYMTIPGLLAETDAGEIAGLVAPRPQLICVGEADDLTPMPAVAEAWEKTRAAYAGAPDALTLFTEPGVGHTETAAMRRAVLGFFEQVL